MNLELKHLAPYLPYGLKGILMSDQRENFSDIEVDDIEIFNKYAIWTIGGYADSDLNIPLGEGELNGFLWRNGFTYAYFANDIKPILRPLSQLTEEINHDNQWFTPIDTLDMNFLDFEYFHSNKGIDLSKVTYLDVVRLFSWHFDVFGLIETDLAIAVTDEINPYK